MAASRTPIGMPTPRPTFAAVDNPVGAADDDLVAGAVLLVPIVVDVALVLDVGSLAKGKVEVSRVTFETAAGSVNIAPSTSGLQQLRRFS